MKPVLPRRMIFILVNVGFNKDQRLDKFSEVSN